MAQDSSAVLRELLGEVDVATKEMQVVMAEDVGIKIDSLQEEFDKAAKIKDVRMREARLRVLNVTFEELRKQSEKKQEDLARAMFGLQAYIEKFGEVYKNLGEPSPADKQLLAQAQQDIARAEEELREAGQKIFFKGRAVASAQAELDAMKQKRSDLEKEVQARTRQSLLSSDLEQLTQQFLLWSEKTAVALQARIENEQRQIKIVTERKNAAFQIQKDATAAFEKLDKELKAKEAELKAEEDKLTELENGTSEYANQTAHVAEIRSLVEDLRGRVNNAMVLANNKEEFANHLVANEIGHRKVRDNARVFLTILKSSSEERVVLFRSRLELEKGLADQELAKQIHSMGTEIDMDNLETVVAGAAASDRLITKIMQEQPGRMREIANILAAQAEAHAKIREEQQQILDEYRKKYGIDLSTKSFFHYVGKKEGTAKPEEANTF